MSRLAQAVERAVREMREAAAQRKLVGRQVRQGRRPAMEDRQDAPETAAEPGCIAPQDAQQPEGEQDMTKKSSDKKKTAKPKAETRAKKAKESRGPRVAVAIAAQLKAENGLRLAPNGVSAHGAMYIRFTFAEGHSVLLKPVNLDTPETTKVRDVLVDWFSKSR